MDILTPIDIENKQFKRAMFGLNKNNVNQFLNEIVLNYEEIYRENISLKDKINNLSDVVGYYKGMEDTLKETLVHAEKTAEEIISAAKQKAEQIENEAHIKAKTVVDKAERDVREIKMERARLASNFEVSRTRMYEILNAQVKILDEAKKLTKDEDKQIANDELKNFVGKVKAS